MSNLPLFPQYFQLSSMLKHIFIEFYYICNQMFSESSASDVLYVGKGLKAFCSYTVSKRVKPFPYTYRQGGLRRAASKHCPLSKAKSFHQNSTKLLEQYLGQVR